MNQTLELPALNEYPVADAYPIAKAAIEEMAADYLPLVVESDGTGLKEVHAARMAVKKSRVAVEKRRKELKADAIEYGRKVDGAAKELFAMLEPIETHLTKEEEEYQAEQARIKREAEEARQQALKGKVDQLAAVGHITTTYEVDAMTDTVFAATLEEATEAHKEKLAREEAERQEREKLEAERRQQEEAAEAARREEKKRLAAEREKLEAERQRQADEAAKIEAEKRRLAEEAAERERQAELERQKKLAAEEAAKEERERIAREEAEAKAQAEREEAERQRREALRPDREKLASLADQVAGMLVPVLSEEAADATKAAKTELQACAARIREIASGLK